MNRPGWPATLWPLAFAAISALFIKQTFFPGPKSDWAAQIMFDGKHFFDFAKTGGGFIGASGTLAGPGMAYPNNTYSIQCIKDRNECLISSIEIIGYNQMGRLSLPDVYPIKKWDAYEVIASDETPCFRTTISLVRKTEAVVWVEEPINQSSAQCKDAINTICKFTLEDSPGRKALNKAINKN